MMKRLPLTLVLLFIAFGLLTNPEATAQTPVHDLGITINPLQIPCSTTPGNINANITVTIHNYGTATQTSFHVQYSVDNVPHGSGVWTGTLVPSASGLFTFIQRPNIYAPGTYMIIARVNLVPDSNPSNDADTIYVTNSNMPQGNISLNFDATSNGSDVMRKVINANSGIFQSAAASNGPNSTQGLIMDGKDHANWATPGAAVSPWTSNPAHFAAAYICFHPDSGKVNDTLRLSFDLKQLYKGSHNNTNFRVTVNGQQVGPTYNPPVGGYGGGAAPWTRISLDFSSFIGSPTLEIGLESSVKEEYDNGNGTANLIDNMEVERISARMGTTGVKENTFKNNVTVYPNPSSGLFNISIPEGEACQLEITDLTGKTLLKQEAKTRHNQLDLRGTAKGIYLLKVSGKTGTAVRKLIME